MPRTDATALLVALVLAAMVAGPQARAAQGMLRVGVRVVASAQHDATAELDRLPQPSGARRLTRMGEADSYWCDGAPTDVAGRYHQALVAQGYRLASRSADGLSATYERAQQRVDLRLDPVLGAQPATRVVVRVDTTT